MSQGPYIGLAGITSRAQIDAIVDGWPDDAPPLAMGVLGSYKTLVLRQPNRYPNRYPAWHEIPAIWSPDKRYRQVLHYSFADDDAPRSVGGLVRELTDVGDLSGVTWQRAWLQINARPMIRPWHAEAIAAVANQWNGVIVQVSGAAIDEWYATAHKSFDNDMRETLVRLERIGKVTLLFDASGGNGVPVDVKRIAPLIDLSHTFGFDCGVAGGLSPDTLPRLRPLFDICPLSVDTESWPRDADDRLVIAKAIAFRDAARELYR